MAVLPNPLEYGILVASNAAPLPMFDIMGFVSFRTVLAAVRLGVFDAIKTTPKSPADLARELTADERGMSILLNTLESLGYAQKSGDNFKLHPRHVKWFDMLKHGMLYWGAIFERLWGSLEATLLDGTPLVNLYQWIENEPEVSAAFQEYMVAIAQIGGGEIARKVKLPADARRLLDIGGGHGEYSVQLCRKYPNLQATLFDSPRPLETARKNIDAKGMSGRITLQTGDFMVDDMGRDYDAALLFNIVHGFTDEQNRQIVARSAGTLRRGGMLAVIEQLDGRAPLPIARAFNQLFAVSFFHLLGGSIYPYEQIAGWMTAAGLTDIKRVNLLSAPGSAIITGVKA